MTDEQWIAKARPRGPWVTDDGTPVVMLRKGQRVRFYDGQDRQVGPEHANVYPATVWAYFHGWSDPTAPAWLNAGCRAEVQANSRVRA